MTERQKILGGMVATRDRVHAELATARRQGRLDRDVKSRQLEEANRRLRDATVEAEAWRSRAAEAEEQKRAVWDRHEAVLRRHRVNQEDRVKQAEVHAVDRVGGAQRILDEAAGAFEALHLHHMAHTKTQEKHAIGAAQIRIRAAEFAQQSCLAQVDQAKLQTARCTRKADRDLRRTREEAEQRIARARQELADKHQSCDDTLAQERVCQAQARRLAVELKETQEQDRLANRERMEVQMKLVQSHLEKKVVIPKEQVTRAEEINEVYSARNARLVQLANDRADKESEAARQRAERAKVNLANMQAKYVAEVSELRRRFEGARRSNEAKVKAAEKRSEEVLQYCEERLERRSQEDAKALERSKHLASVNTVAMKEKVSALEDFSDQRVAMVKRQSAERLAMVEQQLEQLRRHTEDVRSRCDERVRAELETVKEKVRLARERTAANAAQAAVRAGEAEATRDEARGAFEEVLARCRGAAAEARRRGLMGIASILEPNGPDHAELLQEELHRDFEAFGVAPPALVGGEAAKLPEAAKEMDGEARGQTASTAVPASGFGDTTGQWSRLDVGAADGGQEDGESEGQAASTAAAAGGLGATAGQQPGLDARADDGGKVPAS